MITLPSGIRVGRRICVASAGMLTLLLCAAGPAAAQPSKSAAAAKALAEALDAAKLDAIAAPDPADPGTFVAALYIQGSQLLVVSAKYAAPSLLVDKMKIKNYREIYIDLNSASVAGTKVFCIDQGVDGLVAKPDNDQASDSWEHGKTQVAFDGDWKRAKMSEQDYMKTFSQADERYAAILALLTAQVKQG
jgi:hypothetical protein